jgi:starch synthase
MRVLHAASEAFPLIKTGGLADVAGALPAAQAALGADVRLVLPGWPEVMAEAHGLPEVLAEADPPGGAPARVVYGALDGLGVEAYVVDCPDLFAVDGHPYMDDRGRDRPGHDRRFGLFAWMTARLGLGGDPFWGPDLVHAHDWQAGLVPLYLRLLADRQASADGPAPSPARRPASVITIHNLAYQGLFGPEALAPLRLPERVFAVDGVEFWGRVGFLKAGLYYADRITTVSPSYAREIQTEAEGCGLDGLLSDRAAEGRLLGILNGIDRRTWNPSTDAFLPARYDADDLSGKAACKTALQRRLGLEERPDAPLFGVISRANRAKGLDLLLDDLPGLVTAGGQLALLTSGDPDLEDGFREALAAWPGRVGGRIGYGEDLAHLIQAGADSILVPSRSEPCGLTQMYALGYGSPPLVRRTGGLADSVVNAEPEAVAAGRATGFVFDDPTAAALGGTLTWAMDHYRDRDLWHGLQRTGMAQDFGWEASARRYLTLYAAARVG